MQAEFSTYCMGKYYDDWKYMQAPKCKTCPYNDVKRSANCSSTQCAAFKVWFKTNWHETTKELRRKLGVDK